jgi:hypothetical protein
MSKNISVTRALSVSEFQKFWHWRLVSNFELRIADISPLVDYE